jgi:hypothetical protein
MLREVKKVADREKPTKRRRSALDFSAIKTKKTIIDVCYCCCKHLNTTVLYRALTG